MSQCTLLHVISTQLFIKCTITARQTKNCFRVYNYTIYICSLSLHCFCDIIFDCNHYTARHFNNFLFTSKPYEKAQLCCFTFLIYSGCSDMFCIFISSNNLQNVTQDWKSFLILCSLKIMKNHSVALNQKFLEYTHLYYAYAFVKIIEKIIHRMFYR